MVQIFLTHSETSDQELPLNGWKLYNHLSYHIEQLEGIKVDDENSYANYTMYHRAYTYHTKQKVVIAKGVSGRFRICVNLCDASYENLLYLIRKIISGFKSFESATGESTKMKLWLFGEPAETNNLKSEFCIIKTKDGTFLSSQEIQVDERFDEESVIDLMYKEISNGRDFETKEIENLIIDFFEKDQHEFRYEKMNVFWTNLVEQDRIYYLNLGSYSHLLNHKTGFMYFIEYRGSKLVIPIWEILNYASSTNSLDQFEEATVSIYKEFIPDDLSWFFDKLSPYAFITFILSEKQCRFCGEFLLDDHFAFMHQCYDSTFYLSANHQLMKGKNWYLGKKRFGIATKKGIIISEAQPFYRYCQTSFKSWCLESYPNKSEVGNSCAFEDGHYQSLNVILPPSLFQTATELQIQDGRFSKDKWVMRRNLYEGHHSKVPNIEKYMDELKHDVGDDQWLIRYPTNSWAYRTLSNVLMTSKEIKSMIRKLKFDENGNRNDSSKHVIEPPTKRNREVSAGKRKKAGDANDENQTSPTTSSKCKKLSKIDLDQLENSNPDYTLPSQEIQVENEVVDGDLKFGEREDDSEKSSDVDDTLSDTGIYDDFVSQPSLLRQDGISEDQVSEEEPSVSPSP